MKTIKTLRKNSPRLTPLPKQRTQVAISKSSGLGTRLILNCQLTCDRQIYHGKLLLNLRVSLYMQDE